MEGERALAPPPGSVEVAVEVAQPDRRIHRRRPAAYIAWMVIGGIGTHVDKIHEYLGVVAYPDATWVGEAWPVSPVYLLACVGFFILYTVMVGHRGRAQGLFGGRPITMAEFTLSLGSWVLAYVISGFLGGAGGPWPWIGTLILAAWAAPELWAARRTWLPLFALAVVFFGLGFEWNATAGGAFVYPVCPQSPVCIGLTVPVMWLGLLYVHAALFVHRMMGGRYFLFRKLLKH